MRSGESTVENHKSLNETMKKVHGNSLKRQKNVEKRKSDPRFLVSEGRTHVKSKRKQRGRVIKKLQMKPIPRGGKGCHARRSGKRGEKKGAQERDRVTRGGTSNTERGNLKAGGKEKKGG